MTIEYKSAKKSFVGSVTSVKKCQSRRKVMVHRVRKGSDGLVGQDTTDKKGSYAVRIARPSGRYYARVLQNPYSPKYGTLLVCSGARSKIISVD